MWQAFIAQLVRASEVLSSTLNDSMVNFEVFITCLVGMLFVTKYIKCFWFMGAFIAQLVTK